MTNIVKSTIGITWMFCLFSISLVMTSCSSDINETEGSEQNNEGCTLRELTITEVPIAGARLEESTDNSNEILIGKWTSDQATYFNLSTYDVPTGYNMDWGYLTTITSTPTSISSFTGSVRCERDHYLAFFYPAKTVANGNEQDRGTYTITLCDQQGKQQGTLDDIATNYHYIFGVGQVTETGENPATATATIHDMKSLLTICKFQFKKGDNIIPIQKLEINYADYDSQYGYSEVNIPLTGKVTIPHLKNEDFISNAMADAVAIVDPQAMWKKKLTIDFGTRTSDVAYVALFPVENQYFKFTVTNSNGTYTRYAKATLKAGKFYPVTMSMTEQP